MNDFKYRATMPRGNPPEGKAQFVVAVKSARGRYEYAGPADEDLVLEMWAAAHKILAKQHARNEAAKRG